MDGERIPKATMNNFIRAELKLQFNPEVTQKLLDLAKLYICRLTDKANSICSKNNRKTINPEHLQGALQALGMQDHIKQVRDASSNLKAHQQLKQEKKAIIENKLVKMLQEDNKSEEIKDKRLVEIREHFPMMDVKNSESEDYEEEDDEKQEQ